MDVLEAKPKSAEEASRSIRVYLIELLEKIRQKSRIPGIAITVSIQGIRCEAAIGELAEGGVEPMSVDARFQIGCITKPMVAMVAAEFVADGRLDPDARISRYIPELADIDVTRELSVWHLLSHTSGVQGLNINDPAVAYSYNWDKFLAHLRGTRRLFTPGSVFSYDHSEYALVGEIVERISGCKIGELLRTHIVEPLGLTTGTVRGDQQLVDRCVVDHTPDSSAGTFRKLKPIPFGAFWRASLSDLTMSLSDILRIAEAIPGISRSTAGRPTPEAMELVQKQVLQLPAMFGSARAEQLPASFGLGCAAYRGSLLGHNGSARGQTCGFRFDPRAGFALAVGLNSWQPYLRDKIINHVMGVLRGQSIPPAPRAQLELPVDDLPGTYYGPGAVEARVVQSGAGGLSCSVTAPGQPQPLVVDMRADEKFGLVVSSDTQHHSLAFFREPESGIHGLMFGMTALRKGAQ